jgi:serine/threonine protein kinase
MGAVYEAIHSRLGRSVAIKVLPRPVAVDPEYQIRFEREVRAVGKLDHPNVVRATDAGVMDGVPYLVMELVDGVDLARMVRSIGPLPIADACEIVRQAAEGLTHAHRKGIVHRDVKPSNLMVTAVGVVKVLDMGLAIFVSHMDQISERITGPTVLGTHDYMAPEQWLDPGVVSEKVDIYGLGCVLFQTLVGQPPFSGIEFESPHAKKRAHINTPPPNVATIRQEVPGPLAHLIRRMLAKKPEDRPTCNELADTLKTFIPSPPLLVRQVERTRLAPSTGFTDGNPTALAPVGADPALSPTVDGLNQITSRTPLPDINGDPNRIRAWEFTVALTLLIIMMLFGMVALVSGMFQ